jgi:hypothetical protein
MFSIYQWYPIVGFNTQHQKIYIILLQVRYIMKLQQYFSEVGNYPKKRKLRTGGSHLYS